jgi:hypothetical protein
MLHRTLLLGLLLFASHAATTFGHPGSHGAEEVTPPAWDESVQDPTTAWTRLQQHRAKLVKSVKAADWDTTARLGTELGSIAGDLVRVSGDLPPDTLGPIIATVRDLGITGRQLAVSARASKASRVSDLLLRVDYYMKTIVEKYPKGMLTP